MTTHPDLKLDREQLHRDSRALMGRRMSSVDTRTTTADIEFADALSKGRLRFPATGEFVQIGMRDIDWSGGQHDHHAWHPGRFRFLLPLCRIYRAQKDDSCACTARDYIADWCNQHPERDNWRPGANDNPLNIAGRNSCWGEAIDAFAVSPEWDDAFLTEMVDAMRAQLNYLQHNLSPRNNFRLHQARALLHNGIRLRQIADSQSWRRVAVRTFNEAARRQILPDGAHAERTPSYHRAMTRDFADCLRFEPLLDDEAFSFDAATIAPMFDYWLAATRPNGSLCAINDSEGIYEGRQANEALAERSQFRREHGLPESLPEPQAVFPDAQHAFLRDGWGADAGYMTFDAGKWEGAHGHLSRNAVQLHTYGRSFLVDPGRIDYEMSNPLGPYGKSTRAHCTANLNGWNQSTADPVDFRAFHAPGFSVVRSHYNGGYWPRPFGWWFSQGMGHGLGATHDRTLLWVHGRWALVVDELVRWHEPDGDKTHREPSLEINWQLAPGPVELDRSRRQARTVFDDANLHMYFPLMPEGAVLSVHEGENTPVRGWVRKPEEGFGGIPAPMISVETDPMPRYDDGAITLLAPRRGTEPPPIASITARRAQSNTGGGKWIPGECTITWQDGSRETVIWTPKLSVMLGEQEELNTDGSLLYTRRDADGVLENVAAVDATWCDSPVPPVILPCQFPRLVVQWPKKHLPRSGGFGRDRR